MLWTKIFLARINVFYYYDPPKSAKSMSLGGRILISERCDRWFLRYHFLFYFLLQSTLDQIFLARINFIYYYDPPKSAKSMPLGGQILISERSDEWFLRYHFVFNFLLQSTLDQIFWARINFIYYYDSHKSAKSMPLGRQILISEWSYEWFMR